MFFNIFPEKEPTYLYSHKDEKNRNYYYLKDFRVFTKNILYILVINIA